MESYGEVTGIVTKIDEKNGSNWARKEIVIDNGERFDHYVLVRVWERNFDKVKLVQLGTRVKCRFKVASREWQGKYYTELTLTDIIIIEQPKTQMIPPEVSTPYVELPQKNKQEEKCLLDEVLPKLKEEDAPF